MNLERVLHAIECGEAGEAEAEWLREKWQNECRSRDMDILELGEQVADLIEKRDTLKETLDRSGIKELQERVDGSVRSRNRWQQRALETEQERDALQGSFQQALSSIVLLENTRDIMQAENAQLRAEAVQVAKECQRLQWVGSGLRAELLQLEWDCKCLEWGHKVEQDDLRQERDALQAENDKLRAELAARDERRCETCDFSVCEIHKMLADAGVISWGTTEWGCSEWEAKDA